MLRYTYEFCTEVIYIASLLGSSGRTEFLGSDLNPVFIFHQYPVCRWTYRDHDLTTYSWLSREKNRYTSISCCLFLSINTPGITSCRLVENRRTYTLILAPLYLDIKLKSNRVWLKLKMDSGPRKKIFGPEPSRVWAWICTCPQLSNDSFIRKRL